MVIRVFRGEGRSRSGYFGESWGDYLIDFINLWGFWEFLFVFVRHWIFSFLFFFFFFWRWLFRLPFFRLYVAGAWGLFGLQGVCGFTSRIYPYPGLVLCLCWHNCVQMRSIYIEVGSLGHTVCDFFRYLSGTLGSSALFVIHRMASH